VFGVVRRGLGWKGRMRLDEVDVHCVRKHRSGVDGWCGFDLQT
jgi:hypothetical protein